MNKKINAVPVPLPFQTPGEEIANSILHGTGAVMAVAGLVLLALKAHGALSHVSCAIYCASMFLLFMASTMYHAMVHDGAKRVFRVLDHSAIYLLIAGTYTPFSLLAFGGRLGWVYFGLEWGLAAAGITLYAANWKFIKKAELAIYIMMGWACVAGLPRLLRSLPLPCLVFLVAGGICYTLGTFWYSKANHRTAHVIWHVFVLAGAALQWFAIWWLV